MSLWINDIWTVDEEVNCHNCYFYWDNRCHAYGKRFENGYCNFYDKKKEQIIKDAQDEYNRYMIEWN